jgi:hypothetical protein
MTRAGNGLWKAVRAGVCVAAALLAAPAAQAVLGGDASTVHDDETRLKGASGKATALRAQVQSHEIAMADGSSIREFVTPAGVVFAVAWSTRFKPDLASLLGAHAAGYSAAAADAMRAPGIKRQVVLQRGDLVVHSTTHLNVFVGKAYLRSLVPPGMPVDELR